MDIQKKEQYKSTFDLIAKNIKDDEENTIEVWYARELQQLLGSQRSIQDFMLTRYACRQKEASKLPKK